MILDLTELRQDYKSTYRNNWPLAEKIKILIEVTKIEQRFQSHAHQSKKSLRTLIRWKQLYRKKGPQGIALKKKGHPPRQHLPLATQSLIKKWRERYRW